MKNFAPMDSRMKFRKELYTIDVVVYIGGEDLFRDKLWYPSAIYAVIEHEMNHFPDEEMWKILHWRSTLKVLIFYDWAEDEKTTEARENWLDSKLNTFKHMMDKVDAFHAESSDTEYVFIIGKTINNQLYWHWASKSFESTKL